MNTPDIQSTLEMLAQQTDQLLLNQLDCVVAPQPVYDGQDKAVVKLWHLAYAHLAERWFVQAFGEAEGASLFQQLAQDATNHLQEHTNPEKEPSKNPKIGLGRDLMELDEDALSAKEVTDLLRLLIPGFIAYCHHWLVDRFGATDGARHFDTMHSYIQRISVESKEPTYDFAGFKSTLATPDSVMIGFIRRVDAVDEDTLDVTYLACPNHAAAVRLGLDPNCCDHMCGPEFRIMEELFDTKVENPENFCQGSGQCVQRYTRGTSEKAKT